MELKLTTGAQGRPRLGLPMLRALNAITEETPGGPTPVVRTSRPGLTRQYTLGAGPILRQQQLPGVYGGSVFSVSGGSLYRDANLVGTVAYGQFPRIASANGQVAITSGGGLWVYQGATLTQIKFFNDGVSPLPPFSCVVVLYNIFIYAVQGSNTFFFSQVGDATNINAANFSSAQTNPAAIVEVGVLAEELYFFKAAQATEIWTFTGALFAPFALSQGRTYKKGISSQGTLAGNDNALFWVGDDLEVYRSSTVPEKISTPLIDDLLRSSDINAGYNVAYNFDLEGHSYYVLNIAGANQTWAYDAQTKQWFQWGTLTGNAEDPGPFLPQTSVGQGALIIAGSSVDGRVWVFDETNHTDDGVAIRVIVGGYTPMSGGYMRASAVSLHMVRGIATAATPAPKVFMRYSDDGAQTWTGWAQANIGSIGSYKMKATWRGLGLIRQPGRYFEFAISDAVNITIEGASINEGRT